MHYGTDVYNDLLPIKSFIEDVPVNQVTKPPGGNELLVDPAEKAKEKPVIVLLGYEKRGK